MPKRTLQGVVVSDKQAKTVVVRVDRRFAHATMKKTISRSKKYHAHDETNEYSVGDIVWLEEHRQFRSSSAGPWSGARSGLKFNRAGLAL